MKIELRGETVVFVPDESCDMSYIYLLDPSMVYPPHDGALEIHYNPNLDILSYLDLVEKLYDTVRKNQPDKG